MDQPISKEFPIICKIFTSNEKGSRINHDNKKL